MPEGPSVPQDIGIAHHERPQCPSPDQLLAVDKSGYGKRKEHNGQENRPAQGKQNVGIDPPGYDINAWHGSFRLKFEIDHLVHDEPPDQAPQKRANQQWHNQRMLPDISIVPWRNHIQNNKQNGRDGHQPITGNPPLS